MILNESGYRMYMALEGLGLIFQFVSNHGMTNKYQLLLLVMQINQSIN